MTDIFNSFLADSSKKAMEIARESDILDILHDLESNPPSRYLLVFKGIEHLLRTGSGIVEAVRGIVPVEVRFPPDYLLTADPGLYLRVALIVDPWLLGSPYSGFFHPNFDPLTGAICLGAKFAPGTPLPALIFHVHTIITYQNYSVDERNCLDPTAARYLREHPEAVASLRVAPLRRRQERFRVTVAS
jgi:hypothetical protein